jgi:hypothetical protein
LTYSKCIEWVSGGCGVSGNGAWGLKWKLFYIDGLYSMHMMNNDHNDDDNNIGDTFISAAYS